VTPNQRFFDFVTGTTATITAITGGNPNLRADNRRVDKIGLTIAPWTKRDVNFTANFTHTRIDDPIQSLTSPTAAIQAVFPDRFVRDAAGNLLRVDTRPVNFAKSEASELRYGINFSVPLKSKIQKQIEAFRAGTGPNPFAGMTFPGGRGPGGGDGQQRRNRGGGGSDSTPPPSVGEAPAGAAPGDNRNPDAPGGGGQPGQGGPGRGFGGGGFGGGGGGGFRGGGFGGGGRGGGGGGRLQFAVYHTWRFTNRVTVADGGPTLDLLNGDTLGGGGGTSRHEIEGQAGYNNNGLGARLSINYASGTRVNGGTPGNPDPLNFSGLGTADLRLFADLGQQLGLVREHPWVRGMRVTFAVTNLLNSRQRVTTADGTVPVSYQPAYLDPLGRAVRVSVRKLFF
jgi:hypothetical protein